MKRQKVKNELILLFKGNLFRKLTCFSIVPNYQEKNSKINDRICNIKDNIKSENKEQGSCWDDKSKHMLKETVRRQLQFSTNQNDLGHISDNSCKATAEASTKRERKWVVISEPTIFRDRLSTIKKRMYLLAEPKINWKNNKSRNLISGGMFTTNLMQKLARNTENNVSSSFANSTLPTKALNSKYSLQKF